MNTVVSIFIIVFAGGTFLVALLQFIRQMVKDLNDRK